LSDKPLNDGPPQRAAVLRQVEETLVTAVDHMRGKLGLTRSTAELVKEIKATMDLPLVPYNFTVIQTLCEHERDKVRNRDAAESFPDVKQDFDDAIRDLTAAIEGKASTRRLRKLVGHAWKWDSAADRRTQQGSASPYKGRPQLCDPNVVCAFADAVARASGRSHVTWTRRTDDNKSVGVILDVFVATVQWAICEAWRCSAPFGQDFTKVKAEGLLGVLRAARRQKQPTD
jgi:hypothetical protein